MRTLALTTLYPYPARPRHGIFVENRLRALTMAGADLRVVAPVPWFPLKGEMFGDWANYADPPREETRHGIKISHPQYALIPKFGMAAAVGRLEEAFEKAVLDARADGFEPELLDAHYLYPDGVAATRVGKRLGLPVVLTARGSDVTQLPHYPAPRRMIKEALADADHIITVAEALRQDLIALGADPSKVTTIRNGVDLDAFAPGAPAPTDLPPGDGPLIVSVGHLIQRKGHDLAIEAVAQLPGARLVIVGGGPEAPALEFLVRKLRFGDRVRFAGEQPHDALAAYYGAADLLMLGSDREGWPNVLLEAMACGTPCVATPAGGVAEVITAPEAGAVTPTRSADALAVAARQVLDNAPDRAATRAYAEQFGWTDVADDVLKVWRRAVTRSPASGWGTPVTASRPPRLLLTVDTEEIFDWEGDYTDWQVTPASALDRLQETAEAAGVVPLYFVTHPIITDEAAGSRLARWQAAGTAECGLHLHSWVTPPEGAPLTPARTFQLFLEPDEHREKLAHLISAYRDRFGKEPVSHRAGRYGIAPWVLDQLAEHGVMLDFSPSAGFDFRRDQGPDFSGFPVASHCRQTRWGEQWVIPVSGTRWVRKAGWAAPVSASSTGLSRRLAKELTAPIRLTPEGNTLGDLQKLTRQLVQQGSSVLTPTLHLTSVHPGATPYAADDEGVARQLGVLKDYLEWAQAEGIRPITQTELRRDLGLKAAHGARAPETAPA